MDDLLYMQMVQSEFGVSNMDPACLMSTVPAGGSGSIVLKKNLMYTLGSLIPIEQCLNALMSLTKVCSHFVKLLCQHRPESLKKVSNTKNSCCSWGKVGSTQYQKVVRNEVATDSMEYVIALQALCIVVWRKEKISQKHY